jgi:hypothetical protein
VRSAFSQGRSWTCPSPLKWQEARWKETDIQDGLQDNSSRFSSVLFHWMAAPFFLLVLE